MYSDQTAPRCLGPHCLPQRCLKWTSRHNLVGISSQIVRIFIEMLLQKGTFRSWSRKKCSIHGTKTPGACVYDKINTGLVNDNKDKYKLFKKVCHLSALIKY